jgi:glutaminyl-peptide cyclotransferase
MKLINIRSWAIFAFSAFVLGACTDPIPPPPPAPSFKEVGPKFDSENAYNMVAKQVAFGPRVPGTPAHDSCATWLLSQFESYGATVTLQTGNVFAHNGTKRYDIKNIIATINPTATKRILLCAHWDSRAQADQETDPEKQKQPVLGADDGASGVGVLLEVARAINSQALKNIGVDIVLFDVEDQGRSGNNSTQSWCLGAQYWSKTPHVEGYKAEFGILLDMVGARGARFVKEGVSLKHAAMYVDKVWKAAWGRGYRDFFHDVAGKQLIDDHVFINEIRQIPTIDIINSPANSETGFGAYWHTLDDNMDIISKTTLEAVGQTLLQVLYQEEAGIVQ